MDSVSVLDWAALDWVGANPVVAAVLLILLALVVLVFGAIFGPFGRGRGRSRGRNGLRDDGAVVRRHDSGSWAKQTDEPSATAAEADSIDSEELVGRLLSKRVPGAVPEVDPANVTAARSGLLKAVEALKARAGRDREPDRAVTALRHLGGRRLAAAETIFREILAEKRQEPFDGQLEAAAAARHLGALAVLHDTAAALAAYEAAVELDSQDAGALTSLGEIYSDLGRPDDAERTFEQLLRIGDLPDDDEVQRAIALASLARIAHQRGDAERAHDLYERSMNLSRDLGHFGHVALNLGNLGILFYDEGKYDLAEEMLTQALALEDNLGNEAAMITAMNHMGLVHKARGELEAAQGMFEETIAVARRHQDRDGEGFGVFNLANLAAQRGERKEASRLYHQLLTLAEASGGAQAMAAARAGLGDLAEENGDLEAARTQWSAARDLYRQAGVDAQVAAMDDMLAKTQRPPVKGA
ncbi:tetratricopeptide repeat protein [Pelagibius litoralis]|uniref:Tetratricopeptide repeat protein n=1 Tax=Pelagibius litoralis TaxID=374515 RepID=A0A967F370_9PROT|nr:tetratricopeptide repeat protein [Pelagibius litoralis]NIA72245.1 tetratricopeptide repeat protein [Pelagibius litoralis]